MSRRLAGHPHPMAERRARARVRGGLRQMVGPLAAWQAALAVPPPVLQSMVNQMLERQAIARYTGMIR